LVNFFEFISKLWNRFDWLRIIPVALYTEDGSQTSGSTKYAGKWK
jgi:hypothetical protein